MSFKTFSAAQDKAAKVSATEESKDSAAGNKPAGKSGETPAQAAPVPKP